MSTTTARWHAVCPIATIAPDRGVAALVDGRQVALFRVKGTDEIFAIDNVDPFTGVGCLSRGIVGDKGGELMVASPLHKQRFSLRTGRCLDDPDVSVAIYSTRVLDDHVEVQLS
jgi:NAD(P)H-dependent nitrite reductase small subunit